MQLLPSREELDQAAQIVYANMAPTPQYAWPLLGDQLGFETWLKHENHTPIGAFKIRGGLVCFSKLIEREPDIKGVISATRIVQVSDTEVAAAMKLLFAATHQVVEGAGAAPLAAAFAERERLRGRKVGLVASGGNVDHDVFARVLR